MSHRLVLAVFAATLTYAQQPCENLKSLALTGDDHHFRRIRTRGLRLLCRRPAPATNTVQVPAFCRVAGVVAPEVKFEMWLPAQWNRKLLAVGNGGLAGAISLRGHGGSAPAGICGQQHRHRARGAQHQRRELGAGALRAQWSISRIARSTSWPKRIRRSCTRSTARSRRTPIPADARRADMKR